MQSLIGAATGMPALLDQGEVFGPELTVVVGSGNIPGAALPSVVTALLLGSPCMVKTSRVEPHFFPWYRSHLARIDPALAEGLMVAAWDGGHEHQESAALESALLAETDALIMYGGNAALTSLRNRLPAHARFIGYGHRISFGAVGREWLRRDRIRQTAARVALDAALFDQQGCLSPQAFYVEEGGEVGAEEFGPTLGEALARISIVLPRRPLSPAETYSIHLYRARMEMRAFGGEGTGLWVSPQGTAWTVALDPVPALRPCCLNRTVVLHDIPALEELPRHLGEARSMLMSASLGCSSLRRQQLAPILGAAGVTRICPLGYAQRPRSAHHHDGMDAAALLTRRLTHLDFESRISDFEL